MPRLEEMRDRRVKALDEAVSSVTRFHNDTRLLVETRSREREWDQTAEARARAGTY